jgi:hypothetical protein
MQQILVLINDSSFIFNCTFQVLCCVCVWGGGRILVLSDVPTEKSLVP